MITLPYINFKKQIKVILSQFMETCNLSEREFTLKLSDAIVYCFHIPTVKLTVLEKAILILDSLFESLSLKLKAPLFFSVSVFFEKNGIEISGRKKITTELLYSLYYGEVDLNQFNSEFFTETLESQLLQISAAMLAHKKMKSILRGLHLHQQIHLISFCLHHYREGSYPILNILEIASVDSGSKEMNTVVNNLRRQYFDKGELKKILFKYPKLDLKQFKEIVAHLEDSAYTHSNEFLLLLNTLIPLIIEFPFFTYVEEEKIKIQTLGVLHHPSPKNKLEAEKQRDALRTRFEVLCPEPYTLDNVLEFTRLFGLKGHAPLLSYMGEIFKDDSLLDKFRFLIQIFSNYSLVQKISRNELSDYFAFVWSLIGHLDALKNKPEKYLQGFEKLTCAIPTKDKILEFQPALPSLLKGQKTLMDFINSRASEKVVLSDYPFFVFDQSEEKIFKKNNGFICRLNRQYKSRIVHISLKETLKLAKLLDITPLIDTSGKGELGFAGARNSIFLITPVLKAAFCLGKRTLDEILMIEKSELLKLFQEHTLGGISSQHPCGQTLLMADDDMEIAEANCFSHSLFMDLCWSKYSVSSGFSVGRWTKQFLMFQTLDLTLKNPAELYRFTSWDGFPNSSLYSELICKPLLCINLPFGNEENQFKFNYQGNPLLQTSYHLGGTRFPRKQIPTHTFCGLEELLDSFIPYTLRIALIAYLIDPLDKHGLGIFPWNINNLTQSSTSMRDLVWKLTQPLEIGEMRKNFWTNLIRLIYSPTYQEMRLRKYLGDLLKSNIDFIIEKYPFKVTLSSSEKKSLIKIGQVYKFYQQDAAFFWEYALNTVEKFQNNSQAPKELIAQSIDYSKSEMELKHKIRFRDYPLTQGLYLLFHSIGNGEFNTFLIKLLQNDSL